MLSGKLEWESLFVYQFNQDTESLYGDCTLWIMSFTNSLLIISSGTDFWCLQLFDILVKVITVSRLVWN